MSLDKALGGAALVACVSIVAVAWLLAGTLTGAGSPTPSTTFVGQIFAVGLATLLGAGLAWMARDIRRLRRAANELQQSKDTLEAEVGAHEASVRDSHARLQSIIDSAVDGIIVISATGRIESFNHGAEVLFGYPASEVIGRNVNMLMPSPYHEEHDGYLARYLATGEARIIGIGREVTGRRRDGTTLPLHLSVGEMQVGGERRFTGILHDLSERVRIEEQLREKTAMAMIGEMAAVVAHEVKNPLAGVRGAIQVIGSRLPAGSKDAAMVKEILGRVDSLDELMKDLLLFARPPQPRAASVELTRLVERTVDLLAQDPTLKAVRVEIDGSVPAIQADAELLKIVFHNLLMNAAHAMHGEGTIRVSVKHVDHSCHIAFTDSGPGIPREIRERVFTPFFTTKTRGSGLGLPTAKRLIEAHHGRISIDCPPDGGTSVLIELPASAV